MRAAAAVELHLTPLVQAVLVLAVTVVLLVAVVQLAQ
jgi:hypothetical protein